MGLNVMMPVAMPIPISTTNDDKMISVVFVFLFISLSSRKKCWQPQKYRAQKHSRKLNLYDIAYYSSQSLSLPYHSDLVENRRKTRLNRFLHDWDQQNDQLPPWKAQQA